MDKKVTAMFTHLLYVRYYCALSWSILQHSVSVIE